MTKNNFDVGDLVLSIPRVFNPKNPIDVSSPFDKDIGIIVEIENFNIVRVLWQKSGKTYFHSINTLKKIVEK